MILVFKIFTLSCLSMDVYTFFQNLLTQMRQISIEKCMSIFKILCRKIQKIINYIFLSTYG
jgi:hypothetical protein